MSLSFIDRPKKSPRPLDHPNAVRHRNQVALGRKILEDLMPTLGSPEVLFSQRKWFEARDKIIYTLRAQGLSLTAIGVVMDRDHSTIVKSLQRTARRLHEEAEGQTHLTCPMCGSKIA